MVDSDDRAALRRALADSTATGPIGDLDLRLRHRDGEMRWVEAKVSTRVNAPGVDGWVVNLREVTDRRLLEEELRRQAQTDPLTGLVNRAEFGVRLTRAVDDINPDATPAVLFLDLDGFKAVNDTLGHAVGDALLIAVAARLSSDVRGGDCVARLGGDEFAILLARADAGRARHVAERILRHLRQPLHLAGHTVTVSASIGGVLAVPGDTSQTLLHRADTAMYSVKRGGKGNFELHLPTALNATG